MGTGRVFMFLSNVYFQIGAVYLRRASIGGSWVKGRYSLRYSKILCVLSFFLHFRESCIFWSIRCSWDVTAAAQYLQELCLYWTMRNSQYRSNASVGCQSRLQVGLLDGLQPRLVLIRQQILLKLINWAHCILMAAAQVESAKILPEICCVKCLIFTRQILNTACLFMFVPLRNP